MKRIIVFLMMIIAGSQLVFGNLELDRELDRLSFDKNAQKSSKASFKAGVSSFVFERPFKRKRISDENYLKQVIVYINRNPLDISLNINEYLFSSYSPLLFYPK